MWHTPPPPVSPSPLGLSLVPTWVHTWGPPEHVRWVPPGCSPALADPTGAQYWKQTEGRLGEGWGLAGTDGAVPSAGWVTLDTSLFCFLWEWG